MLVANTCGEDVVKRHETIMNLTERNVLLEAETKVRGLRAPDVGCVWIDRV